MMVFVLTPVSMQISLAIKTHCRRAIKNHAIIIPDFGSSLVIRDLFPPN